jgi:hypothetical protein
MIHGESCFMKELLIKLNVIVSYRLTYPALNKIMSNFYTPSVM